MGTETDTPKIDQKEKVEVEIEYQDRKRKITDPLPNAWLVSYTKPLMEIQGQSDHRYKRICDRIPSTGADSNQIPATLGKELEIFRNDTVSIIQDGLREGMGSGRSNDLERRIYRYLREVWLSTHRTYFANAKRRASARRKQQGVNS